MLYLVDMLHFGQEKLCQQAPLERIFPFGNRKYPIITVVIVFQFRNLDVPTSVRLGELLTHLQGKGEEACREFYRALHLHVEEVYYSLPTRLRLRG